MLYHGGTSDLNLKTGGSDIQFLMNAGQIIYAIKHSQKIEVPLHYRKVITSTDIWFEVGVPVLASQPFSGNSSAGWTWLNGFFGLQLYWSENLTQWSLGKFTDIGSPEAATIDGESCFIYWARSMYSIDTKVKTGHMWVEFSDYYVGDSRNNPLNALTINNIVRAIAGSYTMPGDAAALQAKLRELGFTDATVVAVSDIKWRVDLYGINYVAYGTTNKIYWPQYLVADMYGVINTPVNGIDFAGEYVNSSGLRCTVSKQFARLGATCLKL